MSKGKDVEGGSFAKMEGRQVILGNSTLRIVWTEILGEYQARVGGGIWYRKDSNWFKVADMAEGEPALVEWSKVVALGRKQKLDPSEFITTQPTSVIIEKNDPIESRIKLVGGRLVSAGVIWSVEECWEIRGGDNKFYWAFKFIPSIEPQEKCLLNVRFNVLSHQFRTTTLPSCCGFYEGIAYAIYPRREDPWWMRLDGPKLVHNTHYPFTYKPTKVPSSRDPILIQGYFLADEINPTELPLMLHDYLDPQPDELKRTPESILEAAYTCITRSYKKAISSGHFKDDEGALMGTIHEEGFKHHHMRARETAYDVGFTLTWAGQVISPLLSYYKYTGDEKAKEMAIKIGNWIVRHAQTDYGAFHEVYDIELKQGCDFVGEDLLYAHTSARNAAEILDLYSETGDKKYLDSGLKACDWFLRIQEPSGAVQWKFVDSTGELEGPPAYAAATAEVLTAWTKAYILTREEKYLRAAEKSSDWATRTFVDKNFYGGFITDDLYPGAPTNGFNRWETPSPTAICFLIDGFVSLYKATGKEKYIEVAEKAGHFLGLYQWLWEFPPGCLKYHVKGTTQASGGMPYCIDQTFGSELPLEIEALLTLSEVTNKPLWLKMLKMAFARLADCQFADKDSPYYGSVWEGWSLTKNIPLPRVQGNLLCTTRVPDVVIRYMKVVEKG